MITRLQDGSLANVDSDVLAVGRRLQEGDATLGWPGDPSLSLCFDHDRKVWCAVHVDKAGLPYVVADHPTCDAGLIAKVVFADNQLHDVAAAIDRANARVEAERAWEWNDWLDNHYIPKSRALLRRDQGVDTKGVFTSFARGA